MVGNGNVRGWQPDLAENHPPTSLRLARASKCRNPELLSQRTPLRLSLYNEVLEEVGNFGFVCFQSKMIVRSSECKIIVRFLEHLLDNFNFQNK